jgi:hypothetical protein
MAARMTEDYPRSVGRLAYLRGWSLASMHNRLSIMEKLPGPSLLAGIATAASPDSAAMLHDYVVPEERLVACPNQDVSSSGDTRRHRKREKTREAFGLA